MMVLCFVLALLLKCMYCIAKKHFHSGLDHVTINTPFTLCFAVFVPLERFPSLHVPEMQKEMKETSTNGRIPLFNSCHWNRHPYWKNFKHLLFW